MNILKFIGTFIVAMVMISLFATACVGLSYGLIYVFGSATLTALVITLVAALVFTIEYMRGNL